MSEYSKFMKAWELNNPHQIRFSVADHDKAREAVADVEILDILMDELAGMNPNEIRDQLRAMRHVGAVHAAAAEIMESLMDYASEYGRYNRETHLFEKED